MVDAPGPDEPNEPPPEGSAGSGELVLYRTEDGRSQIQMRAADGTVWLTQAQMAELFDTSVQNVNQRITAILDDGELTEATINSELIVRQEGSRLVRREIQVYNLEMILAVGYRVRSPRGVQFRQWATTVLREYLIKGFVLNDERLKDPQGYDYFDELLERIRDIRASEKRFYQKVRDVFTTSVDYDSGAQVAKDFFATIQNKLVYGVTGRTAAELVIDRADAAKPNMGLKAWKGGVVRKGDVTISKNYLNETEIGTLNILTTQFLDFAELRARRRQTTTMADWIVQTDRFLELNEMPILRGKGSVSHADMQATAAALYAHYDKGRKELETIKAEIEVGNDVQVLAGETVADDITDLENLKDPRQEP